MYLRDFKAHIDAAGNDIAWRYFLEYAPYGNLENLRSRYKAFNRYLPELFLWHVFNGLAKAICELENLTDNPEIVILHLDIKPLNIFLGYEELHRNDEHTGGLHNSQYPAVKLGDFGCAFLTHDNHNGNPRDCNGIGTTGYQAPVCA